MEGLAIISWLLALILLPLSPQIVGFISYLLLRKHNDVVAHILGVSVPPVAFFYFFKRLFSVDFVDFFDNRSQKVIVLLLLALVQLIFSFLIQMAVHHRHKLKVRHLT
jgi:hypothetical protein